MLGFSQNPPDTLDTMPTAITTNQVGAKLCQSHLLDEPDDALMEAINEEAALQPAS